MAIEFNDVRLQYASLQPELDAAVSRVLRSGVFVLGPQLEAFEREFARYCGRHHGVGVASGTDALTIALTAVGAGPGDEVIVPAMSAASTALAVIAAGARPVFADISETDFTMDPASAAERINRRTKAIVPVHLYGMPARTTELGALGVPLIEDAAQAHGSRVGQVRCGALGRAAAFSFYPTKNLGAFGDGGMIVTDDDGLANRAMLLRNYGQSSRYASEIVGRNSRLDELHAALLRVKLERLDGWNDVRRRRAQVYREGLAGLPLSVQESTGESNYHLFVIRTQDREGLRRTLAARSIPSPIHYPVALTRQTAFLDFDPGPCPRAEELAAQVLSIPIHSHMTVAEAGQVVDAIRSFFAS